MTAGQLQYMLFLIVIISSCASYEYKIKTFEAPLDHFGYTTNKTFQIRYLYNDTYVRDTEDPILFYTGNEGYIELFAENTGFMWEIAPILNGMIVFAEHRYYGESLPFGNKSFDSPEHMGYLTSEQALADFAILLELINPSMSPELPYIKNRPVIAFGGSYGGMLAAWFRMKYPHIVYGAIAASAPILQFSDIVPCDVFSRIVTSIFSTAYNRECSTNIQKSWAVLKKLVSTPEGRTTLNNKFKFCTNMTKPEDNDAFVDFLTDVYGNLAMVNYPYNASFLAPLPAYPVREFCGKLAKPLNDTLLLDGLYLALSVYTNYTGKTKCLNYSSANDELGADIWNFQACTEMVMPMCSSGTTDMFPPVEWNLKKNSDDCFKKYGVRPRANAAVINYGGVNLEGASRIIFSNGLLDPWSGGGVLRSPNENVKIIIIPEGAHHLDLRAANDNDPGSVIAARKQELETIKTWLLHY